MNRLAHEVTDDGVLIVLRHNLGPPSSARVESEEAIRFARALLDDLGAGDGLGSGGRKIEIGPLTIDTGAQEVTAAGRALQLTMKEYLLVEALALRPGATLSKERLFDHLYGSDDGPDMKIIDIFVCKVRNKLRPCGARHHLETVWGRGYRLVAEASAGAWENSALQPAGGVQQAILARLGLGEATFLQLWTSVPDASQSGVRNAIYALRQAGYIVSNGDPREARYALAQSAAAA